VVLYANYAYANYVWTLKADSHIACLAHSAPMPFPCHAVPLRVSFPFDLHSAAASDSHLPCHALTMPFFSRPRHSMAWARHGKCDQTRPHCVTQMGKTHYKPLAARHGRGTAWPRHVMCESAFNVI
jgi:hypothetical protein